MSRTYVVDGHQVVVISKHRAPGEEVSAALYTLQLDGQPLAATVKKTRLGRYRAHDPQGRDVGTFHTLRAALERLLRDD